MRLRSSILFQVNPKIDWKYRYRTILRNSLIILSYLYSDSHNVRKDSLANISRRRDPASSRFFAISDFSSRCCQQKNPVLTLIHVQPVLQHFGPDDVSNDVLWKVRETTRYQEFHRSSHLKWFTQKKKKRKKDERLRLCVRGNVRAMSQFARICVTM